MIPSISLIIITCFFESYILFNDWSLWQKILAHVMVVNLVFAFTFYLSKRDLDIRFPIYTAILIAALGPFGPPLALMTFFLYLVYCRTSSSIQDLLKAIFPKASVDPTRDLYEKILHGLNQFDPDYNPLPFLDVISFGTEKQKRLAIEKILRFFRPEFAPALRKALDDSNNGIRVLAATAMATLNRLYYEKYQVLEKKYQLYQRTLSVVLAYAEHCDEYARSMVLDDERAQKMVEHSIEAYEHALTLDPKCFIAILALSRLYVQNEIPEKSKMICEMAMNNDVEIPLEVYKWYMFALYDLKHYEKLRSFALSYFFLTEDKRTSMELKELILSWSGCGVVGNVRSVDSIGGAEVRATPGLGDEAKALTVKIGEIEVMSQDVNSANNIDKELLNV